eukprot:12425361-Alexandrium_andersonii.AAC.1
MVSPVTHPGTKHWCDHTVPTASRRDCQGSPLLPLVRRNADVGSSCAKCCWDWAGRVINSRSAEC